MLDDVSNGLRNVVIVNRDIDWTTQGALPRPNCCADRHDRRDPAGLADAQLAGLPPHLGLFAAFVPTIFAAL